MCTDKRCITVAPDQVPETVQDVQERRERRTGECPIRVFPDLLPALVRGVQRLEESVGVRGVDRDRDADRRAGAGFDWIVTVEENALQGGFGSAVLELLYDSGMQNVKVKRLGIPDRYIEQGSQAQLRKDVGIDAEGIALAVEAFIKG